MPVSCLTIAIVRIPSDAYPELPVIVPGIPPFATQGGNRRMESFFGDEDRQTYFSMIYM